MIPRAILFDLDNTLAESFTPPTAEMVTAFTALLARIPCAIVTSAARDRLEARFVGALPEGTHLENLYLFPDSSAQCLAYQDGAWTPLYEMCFTPEQKERVVEKVKHAIAEDHILSRAVPIGEQVLVRDTQVTIAALGVEAPHSEKEAWDPDRSKRNHIVLTLAQALPDCDVRIGGRTAVDICPKGVDKTYGVRWFSEKLGVPLSEMLYVGDSFYPGGNDAVVLATGVPTRSVHNPKETLGLIREMLQTSAQGIR